jgi:hypothetical protein
VRTGFIVCTGLSLDAAAVCALLQVSRAQSVNFLIFFSSQKFEKRAGKRRKGAKPAPGVRCHNARRQAARPRAHGRCACARGSLLRR